jgi:hypothetical protein
MLSPTLEKRATRLRRATVLLRRVVKQFCSPKGPQFSRQFIGDIVELSDALGELGCRPLGKRLQKEANKASKSWVEAFGMLSFLKTAFAPNELQEARRIDAIERRKMLGVQIIEAANELGEQSKLFCDRTDMELRIATARLLADSKSWTAEQAKKSRGGQRARPQRPRKPREGFTQKEKEWADWRDRRYSKTDIRREMKIGNARYYQLKDAVEGKEALLKLKGRSVGTVTGQRDEQSTKRNPKKSARIAGQRISQDSGE